jgi:hypothetical protein
VLASALTAGVAALVFRWYTREPVPLGVATMLGVSVVAAYLNTVGLLSRLGGAAGADVFEFDAVVFNVVAIGVAVFAAPLGRRVGDRAATDVFAVAGSRAVDAEVSRLVRTVGRVTAVRLPDAEDIADTEGYDAVPAAVKEEMGGKTLLFPNRLTVAELHDRLVTRLKDDYRVGYVDVELTERGVVDYLAVGSRAAGIGPTLGHGTVAVSVRGDPAETASPGDVVQVWRPGGGRDDGADDAGPGTNGRGSDAGSGDGERDGPADSSERERDGSTATGRPPERLLTGELRATNGDVATLVVDDADAALVDATTDYRLVSLPAEPRADREFASLLRAADETMAVLSVPEGSALVGRPLGTLDVTVVAARPASGPSVVLPGLSRTVEAGATLYVVARPEVVRRLEAQVGVDADLPRSAAAPAGAGD